MPEGPEIKRAADRLDKVLRDRYVTRVQFKVKELVDEAERFEGHQVREVAARGKALLVHFKHGWSIYSHNQLYGKWFIEAAGKRPSTNRQLRVCLQTTDHAALLYSATEIEVWRTEALDQQPYLARIGLDPLNDGVGSGAIVDWMNRARFRNRQLAGLLLDQAFIAGCGNYLRADILFYAGVHPKARPADLSDPSRRALADAIVSIMNRAYASAGVTNDPHRVATLKAEGVSRKNYRHLAYGRADEACYRCSEEIVQREIGGRRMFYCPGCQTAGAPQ